MPPSVVVLTGAGISKESGLNTFRDQNGLWEGHRVEDVATPEAFARNPAFVYDFYNERRSQLLSPAVSPNQAHVALAEFEKRFAGPFLIVTQNVDNLHERAGSKNILHMHGELLKARCMKSHRIADWHEHLDEKSFFADDPDSLGSLRPHIVWFGEVPLSMDTIETALQQADIFVAIGTSGQVYPAAGFVQMCKPSCKKVELNLEATKISDFFDAGYYGLASQVTQEFFSRLEG